MTDADRTSSAAQRRARDADALIAAARSGDAAAFGRLVHRFRPRIFALALHLSGSTSDADDITQDAFEQAYRHLPSFEGRSHFFTWLYRITVHRALDAQRAQKRAGASLDDARVEAALQIDAPTDPRRALALRETYGTLLSALDALSPSLKSAVVLTALQGLSYREAAMILGTSEGAIAVRIHDARKHLHAALARAHGSPVHAPTNAGHAGSVRPIENAASQPVRPPVGTAPARLNRELALALASVL